jgi:four helix bundle protein
MEPEKPNNFFFRFEDLRIYNKALDYVNWVYGATQSFPDVEQLGLTAHFNSASQAIAINIAEGSGRNKTQFIYYLKMAKSSIRECIVLTSIAQRMNYLSEERVEESRFFLIEMTKMVGALIASLQRTTRTENAGAEEEDDDLGHPINGFDKFIP